MINNENRKNRLLGIDPGIRRMGLAISDPLGITAQGLRTFDRKRDGEFIPYLRNIINEYRVKVVVLGYPLSMSGGEIEGSGFSRELGGRIRDEFDVEIIYRDERITSLSAENVLEQTGGVRDQGDIDRLAAVFILQDYLDHRENRKV